MALHNHPLHPHATHATHASDMRDGLADRRDFEATHRDDVADARDATAIIREAHADDHCWLKSIPMLVILSIVIAFAVSSAVQAAQLGTHTSEIKTLQTEQSIMRDHLAEIHVIRQMVQDIRDQRTMQK